MKNAMTKTFMDIAKLQCIVEKVKAGNCNSALPFR